MNKLGQGEKFRAYVAWAAVCFFWGTTYLAIKVGVKTLPVALFSGCRFSIAGLVLLLLCYIKGYSWPRGREWWHHGLIGLLLITLSNALLVWSSKWLSSGMSALLVTTAPFWMAGLELRFGTGARLGFSGLIGIIVGFLGVALLIGPNLTRTSFDLHFLYGVVALQVGCFSWCLGSVHSKRYPVSSHPLVGAAAQMLIGGLLLVVFGSIQGEWKDFYFTSETALAFLYLVIFGAIIGYGCYIYALDKLPSAKVSTYAYINPVIAVLLGAFWLHEQLDWRIMLSMIIILSGVALVKTAHISTQADKFQPVNSNLEQSLEKS